MLYEQKDVYSESTVIFFMHWILDSSGIGMVGMLGRLMLTLPSEPASLDPDLDQSWGWGTSSRARKSCTVHCTVFSYPIFCSG